MPGEVLKIDWRVPATAAPFAGLMRSPACGRGRCGTQPADRVRCSLGCEVKREKVCCRGILAGRSRMFCASVCQSDRPNGATRAITRRPPAAVAVLRRPGEQPGGPVRQNGTGRGWFRTLERALRAPRADPEWYASNPPGPFGT